MSRNPIRNRRDLARLPARSREAWIRAKEAVTRGRAEDRTLSVAARREGTTVPTIKKYFPEAIEKDKRGWWVSKPADRSYVGEMHITTPEGDVVVAVRGSRARSLVASHQQAVRDFLENRDPMGEGLRRFRGKRVAGEQLASDLDLDALLDFGRSGELDWLDIYERI